MPEFYCFNEDIFANRNRISLKFFKPEISYLLIFFPKEHTVKFRQC